MPKVSPSEERELRAQGRRTMAVLREAGMVVLAEKGYHAARVDDIVKAADVSHGTFYLYFSNKQDLLHSLASQCAEEMVSVVAALGPVDRGESGYATVRAWLADFVENYRRYGVVIRAWMEDTLSDSELVDLGSETFGSVAGTLVARIEAAAPDHIDDPELASAALLALIERYTYFVTSRGSAQSDDEMLDALAGFIHRGWFGGSAAGKSRVTAGRG